VLRRVAATGLLSLVRPQRYDELTRRMPAVMDGGLRLGFRFNADPEIWNALGEITETIRTGKAPLIDRCGGLYVASTQRMTAAVRPPKEALTPRPPALGAIDFTKLGTVVDLGGGHGGFITAILQAHPSVRGI
jgi:hypothetical protein